MAISRWMTPPGRNRSAMPTPPARRPRTVTDADDGENGPGNASEMPAKFVMDHLFERANVGLAMACATLMLVTVIAVLTPWLYSQYGPRWRRRTA